MRCRSAFALILLLLCALPAHAAPPAAPAATATAAAPQTGVLPPIYVGARVGGAFGQAFSELGASFTGEILGGYQLPVLDRRLGLFAALSYAQPSTSGHTQDPRVGSAGGQLNYTTTLRDFGITAGGQLWWPIQGTRFVPFGALGLKLHMTQTVSDTRMGSISAGEYRESDTHMGFLLRLGAGIKLGPGLVAVDATVDSAPIDQLTTGSANSGAIVLAAGYHFFF